MKATSTFEDKLLTGPGEFSFGGARDSGVSSIAQCRSFKVNRIWFIHGTETPYQN
jgi:hypothetical protein